MSKALTSGGREVEHPDLTIAFHWRTKRRVLNLAYALRGRSTGWGDGMPRRWFFGHVPRHMFHRGCELTVTSIDGRGVPSREWTLFKLPFGSGPERVA